jgi:hypothetical protein
MGNVRNAYKTFDVKPNWWWAVLKTVMDWIILSSWLLRGIIWFETDISGHTTCFPY